MKSLLLIAVLLAGACNAPAVSTEQVTSYQQVIAATDLEGQPVGPAAAEHEATVVIFFATWCGPCRKELAVLDEMRSEDPALRIVGINAHEEWGEKSDEKRLRAYLKKNAPWLQVVRANKKIMRSFGGVPKIPTMFLFDRSGNLAASFRRGKEGIPSKDELAAAISAAKARPTAKLSR